MSENERISSTSIVDSEGQIAFDHGIISICQRLVQWLNQILTFSPLLPS